MLITPHVSGWFHLEATLNNVSDIAAETCVTCKPARPCVAGSNIRFVPAFSKRRNPSTLRAPGPAVSTNGATVDAARRPEQYLSVSKARHDQKVNASPFSCQLFALDVAR